MTPPASVAPRAAGVSACGVGEGARSGAPAGRAGVLPAPGVGSAEVRAAMGRALVRAAGASGARPGASVAAAGGAVRSVCRLGQQPVTAQLARAAPGLPGRQSGGAA
ncbi:hypothetical protein ABT174_32970, partial [Streptomyces sparsogenes]